MQKINRHSFTIIILTATLGTLLGSFFAWQSYERLVLVEQVMIGIHTSLLSNTSPSGYAVLPECSNEDQAQYDELLSNLETIASQELQALKLLYARCAYPLPFMQRVQLAQLQSLYTLHESFVHDTFSIHTALPQAAKRYRLVTDLQSLQEERVTKSEELYSIQEQIIDLRLAGVPLSNELYETYQTRAARIKTDLSGLQITIRQVLAAYQEL